MYAIIFVPQAMVSGAGIIALVNEAVAIQIRRHGGWFEQEKCIRTGKRSNDRSVLPEEETCLVITIFPKTGWPYWLSKLRPAVE